MSMDSAPGSSLLRILQRAWQGPCREPLLGDPEVADASRTSSDTPSSIARPAAAAPALPAAAAVVPSMTAPADAPLGRRSPFGRGTVSFSYTPDSSQHSARKDTGDAWMTEEHYTQDFATAVDIAAEEAGLEGPDVSSHGGSTFDLELQRVGLLLQRFTSPVSISVLDYNRRRLQHHSGLNPTTLEQLLGRRRPRWAKVRWIHMEGVAGDALKTLILHFDLHPLSLEDVTQFQRIKVDAYKDYLYIAMHVWQLENIPQQSGSTHAEADGVTSSDTSSDSDGEEPGDPLLYTSTGSTHSRYHSQQRQEQAARHWHRSKGARVQQKLRYMKRRAAGVWHHLRRHQDTRSAEGSDATPAALPRAAMQHTLRLPLQAPFFGKLVATAFKHKQVVMSQVSLFLLPGNVLVSILPSRTNLGVPTGCEGGSAGRPGAGPALPRPMACDVVAPVMERLLGMQSLINESQDASFLLQELLEACLDFSYPTFDAYVDKVASLDRAVLRGEARMELTYRLHVLLTDLAIFRRSIAPIQGMLQNLHNRAGAVMEGIINMTAAATTSTTHGNHGHSQQQQQQQQQGHSSRSNLQHLQHLQHQHHDHSRHSSRSNLQQQQQQDHSRHSSRGDIQQQQQQQEEEARDGSRHSSPDPQQQEQQQEQHQDETAEASPATHPPDQQVPQEGGEGVTKGVTFTAATSTTSSADLAGQPSLQLQANLLPSDPAGPQQQQEEGGRGDGSSSKEGLSLLEATVQGRVVVPGGSGGSGGGVAMTTPDTMGGGAAAEPAAAAAPAGAVTGGGGGGGGSDGLHQTTTSSSSAAAPGYVHVSELTRSYLEDLLDEVTLAQQDMDSLADHTERLLSLVVNSVAQANSDANTTLTVLSTVFLPITFMAGVYGMNFDHLPELHWAQGYMFFWLLTAVIIVLALLMAFYYGFIKARSRALRRLQRNMRSRGRKKGRAAAAAGVQLLPS